MVDTSRGLDTNKRLSLTIPLRQLAHNVYNSIANEHVDWEELGLSCPKKGQGNYVMVAGEQLCSPQTKNALGIQFRIHGIFPECRNNLRIILLSGELHLLRLGGLS